MYLVLHNSSTDFQNIKVGCKLYNTYQIYLRLSKPHVEATPAPTFQLNTMVKFLIPHMAQLLQDSHNACTYIMWRTKLVPQQITASLIPSKSQMM